MDPLPSGIWNENKMSFEIEYLQPILPGGYEEVEVKGLFYGLIGVKKPFNVIIAALFCVRYKRYWNAFIRLEKIKSVVINKLVLQ